MKKLIAIAALALLMGCGARKTEKTESELNSHSLDTAAATANTGSAEIKSSQGEKKQVENVSWDWVNAMFTPIDPDKPMTLTDAEGNTTTTTNANINTGRGSGTGTRTTEEKFTETAVKKDTTAITAAAGHKDDLNLKTAGNATDKKAAINLTAVFSIIAGFAGLALLLYIILVNRKRNERKTNQDQPA